MTPRLHRVLLVLLALTCSAPAQMHKVAKPEQVVRAIGVYEYTGDFAKPAASRLIPVSLYIDGKFQDAGIYIARPIPFALLSGNVYELQTAGIGKGFLDLVYARHLQATTATGDLAYDDGWFGYGKVEPLAAPRHAAALKPSKNLPALQSSTKDTAKPSTDADPDRPTMKRRNPSGDSSGTSGTSASSGTPASSTTATPADDPDRPTMSRRNPDSSGTDTTTTTSASDPAADPDRPTLKRHTPEEARKSRNANDGPSTTGYDSLNNDPNRPNLHHGKPTQALTETDLPKLTGLPVNLHQMVAVSDAANRDPHPFTLDWQDAAQHTAVLQKMQAMAQAQLSSYKSAAPPPAPAPTPAAKNHGTSKTAAATKKAHTAAKTAPPPPIALMDEELKAYTLSYGGAPTYIYSAHTAGTGAALRYVTIVAQENGMPNDLGELKPAIQNVTDAAHLDDTPHMRFIDAVDAEASNRASLLFELRGQNSRQFGLYRVIAAHSDQIFLTGTTQ